MERVQRMFTRMLPHLRTLTYPERLARLKLFSLERRRLRGDLIEAFKQLKGLSDVGERPLLGLSEAEGLRGHALKLSKPRALTRRRQTFFTHRVVNAWNKLPAEAVEESSVVGFKNKLDACWTTIFPDLP